jgi:hypothetical protein
MSRICSADRYSSALALNLFTVGSMIIRLLVYDAIMLSRQRTFS